MRKLVVFAALITALGCSKKDAATGGDESSVNKPTSPPAPPVKVAPCTAADCVLAVDEAVQSKQTLELAKATVPAINPRPRHPVGAMAMDHLIARALLVQDARAHKLTETIDEAKQAVQQGNLVLLGLVVEGKRNYFTDNKFDQTKFDAVLEHLHVSSADAFMAEQRLEQLAYKASQRRGKAVKVTDKDLHDYYKRFYTTVSFGYVEYAAHDSLATAVPTPAQVAAYVKQHDKQVHAKYEQNQRRYRGVSKQVHMRHIFIKRRKPGSKGTADPGYAIAEAARAKLAAGAKFPALAAKVSEDPRTRPRGGDAGWRSREHLGYGVALVNAVKSLALNTLSPVVSTPSGFHIVRFEGERSGDLSYAQVRDEIAAKLANHDLAVEHAAKLAAAAKAKLAAGAKPDALFNEHYEGGGLPKLPVESIQKLAASGKIDAGMVKRLMAARKPRPKLKFDAKGKRLPEVFQAGPFRRDKFIPGLAGGKAMVEFLFDKAPVNEWVVKTEGDDSYLLRVTRRTKPDWKRFETDKGELRKFLQRTRGSEAVDKWIYDTCVERRTAKRIRVNPTYAKVKNAKGESEAYKPCITLKPEPH